MGGGCRQTHIRENKYNNKPKTNNETLLQIALAKLPLHAEEDSARDSLLETEIIAALVSQGQVQQGTAQALVYMLRRQFEVLCLLDRREIGRASCRERV